MPVGAIVSQRTKASSPFSPVRGGRHYTESTGNLADRENCLAKNHKYCVSVKEAL